MSAACGARPGTTPPNTHQGSGGGQPLYHESRFHGGHERQFTAIPHAQLSQLPRTEPAGEEKAEEDNETWGGG